MRPDTVTRLLPALALLLWAQEATAQPVNLAAEKPRVAEVDAQVERAPAATCPGIVLRSTPAFLFTDGFESGDTSAWRAGAFARFSARQILDLEFEVRLDAGVTGDRLLRLDLETPKGHLYQRLTVAFSSSPAAARARKVDGFPRPLAVQVSTAKGVQAPPAVNLSFPVAGTPIVSSSLYGTWRARPFLDDSTTPCGGTQTFVLTP